MSKPKHSPEDDAIVVTLSMNTIRERRGGLRRILAEWRDADGEPTGRNSARVKS